MYLIIIHFTRGDVIKYNDKKDYRENFYNSYIQIFEKGIFKLSSWHSIYNNSITLTKDQLTSINKLT